MKTVQTAMRLPREMHERLKQSPDGVSEEIRRRLERTFDVEDKHDLETRQLAEDIMELALLIRQQAKADWHRHPDVHRALKAAIQTYLERHAPVPETAPAKIPAFTGAKAEAAGSGIASNFVHNRVADRKRQAEIEALEARLAQLKKSTGDKP